MSLYEKYYFIKSNKYLYKLFNNNNDSSKVISNKLNIKEDILDKLYEDPYKSELVSHSVANRICLEIQEHFDDVWEEADLTSKVIPDKPLVMMSHDIIVGLENNIAQKLMTQGLSEKYVEQILNIIDNIVAESVLFGSELSKKGNVEQLKKFALKVRK